MRKAERDMKSGHSADWKNPAIPEEVRKMMAHKPHTLMNDQQVDAYNAGIFDAATKLKEEQARRLELYLIAYYMFTHSMKIEFVGPEGVK